MADEKQNKSGQTKMVCDLSVPTIITALHQNALDKTNAASKNARIVNSAVDDEKEGELKSAGEQIISVVPLDASKGGIEKPLAVELLKTYVQWFVGPDCASKISDSTVIPLDEAPGEKNESFRHVMSFKQFLLEAEEDGREKDVSADDEDDDEDIAADDSEDEEESGAVGDDEDDSSGQAADDEDDDSGQADDDRDREGDDDDEDTDKASSMGYYIAYNLKVEGMKNTALKDAMKKAAKTFFDDLTFKASGLFGGGDSFSIKDIKDKFREAFGPIDPDDLIEQVEKELARIKYPHTGTPDVHVRDKSTLLSDYGDQFTGPQRKEIQKADNSLVIIITGTDPKKPVLNRRVIADVVTSSIRGVYKKFKNKITTDKVIQVDNFYERHGGKEDAIRKVNNAVPTEQNILAFVQKNDTVAKLYNAIDKKFDALIGMPQFDNSSLAKKCYTCWLKYKEGDFKDAYKNNKKAGSEELKTFLDKFLKEYESVYEKYKVENELHESRFFHYGFPAFRIDEDVIKSSILDALVESFELGEAEDEEDEVSITDDSEDESGSSEKKPELDVAGLKNAVRSEIESQLSGESNFSVKAMTNTADVKDVLKSFDAGNKLANVTQYDNCIIVDFSGAVQESVDVKDDIMSILFEDEKAASKQAAEKTSLDLNQMKALLDGIAQKYGIEKHGNVIEVTLGDDSEKRAYVYPFNGGITSGSKESGSEDDGSKQPDVGEGRSSIMFVIPMKGLKYKDKEYNVYARGK